jgi:hypothetical protein
MDHLVSSIAFDFRHAQITIGGTLVSASNVTRAVSNIGTAPSTSTTEFSSFLSAPSTTAAAYTITNMQHFGAAFSTLGATSAITNQYGFFANSNLTVATNNYGFYGNIASGTNRWNLYMAGTATNYMAGDLGIGTTTIAARLTVVGATTVIGQTNVSARFSDNLESTLLISHPASTGNTATITGNNQLAFATGTVGSIAERMRISSTGSVGIGITSLTGITLRLGKTITGATTAYGILQQGIVQSDVTTTAFGYYNEIGTQAAAFTLTNYRHFFATASTIGAGSAVTNQVGFFASATLTGATINYGFQGSIPSGTNRWNLYMDGTANNYMAGQVGIGATSINASAKVQIDSTTQGVLFPRMTATQRAAIASPAEGLIVVQTDGTQGLYLYIGAAWHAITML